MIEKYSCYEYEVLPDNDVWVYVIYEPDYKPTKQTVIRESDEWFETKQEARFAAIGHINLLENGEG